MAMTYRSYLSAHSAEALQPGCLPQSLSHSSSGYSLMDVADGGGIFNCSLICLARFSDDEKLRSDLLAGSFPGLE